MGISGLYAVTPGWEDTLILVSKVRQALEGGARLVQYRNKTAGATLQLEQAKALRALCSEFETPLIVNDHLDLAIKIGADGVHLGKSDGSIEQARRRLGRDKILGVSCYDRLQAALDAQALGADYVAFGSFFCSTLKPDAVAAPLALLAEAKTRLRVPVAAIGGITPDNGARLISAGADALAVISALFSAPDVRRAAQDFAELFEMRPIQ